jgi:TonB family protein
MKRLFAGVGLLLGLLLVTPCASLAAERPWIEVKSPHFLVISDSNEKTARAVAWQFEQVRAAIQNVWPWVRIDVGKPLLVIAVRDEASMKAIAPKYWEERGGVRPASVFVTGADRHYIALRADVKAEDTPGINPYINAYWSYVALVLQTGVGQVDLPLWFFRGLVSVMSNTIVRDSYIQVGHVIPWQLQRLRTGGRLRLSEFLSVGRDSPSYTQADRLEVFDAESWAFAHYLMFGDQGAHQEAFNRFARLLFEGRPPATALELGLGNIETLENGFSAYLSRQLFQFVQIKVDLNVKPEDFATRGVSGAEAAAARAAFHVAMGRPLEARASIEEARKADSRLAASYEVEGLLLENERKTEEALAAYAKAVELGSMQFHPHFRLARLLVNASRRDDAQKEARRALALAGTEDEQRSAQQLVDSFDKSAVSPVAQGTRDAAPLAAAALPPGIYYRPGNGVALPRLLREVKPVYTRAALDAQISGTVLLECVVQIDGTTTTCRVARSLDSILGLDDAAIAAGRQWQFSPGIKDGQPVPVLIAIELTFTLK